MKNSLHFWLTSFFVIAISISYGQSPSKWDIGLQIGLTNNSLYTDDGLRSFTRHSAGSGLQIGVPVKYRVNDWFGIQSELTFIQKNYTVNRTGFFNMIGEDVSNSYLQIPLLAHFSFGGNRLKGFLNLGAFGGYWLSSRRAGLAIDIFSPDYGFEEGNNAGSYTDLFDPYPYDEKVPFNSTTDRRSEFGLVSGIGLQYQIAERYTIFTEARYHYSLTDLQKTYMINQIPRYNNTIGVQLGVFYNLPRRK